MISPRHILTFDTDWCEDFVLEPLLDILEKADYRAVLFLTHRSGEAVMQEIESNRLIQVGIHPNLREVGNEAGARSAISRLIREIPEATACRTHGLIWWFGLARILRDSGLLYDSSLIAPYHALSFPWKIQEIYQFPIFMGDSFFLQSGCPLTSFPQKVLLGGPLKVFNFHPIHLYCNTSNPKDWERIKEVMHNRKRLDSLIRSSEGPKAYGIRDMFEALIENLPAGETFTFADIVPPSGASVEAKPQETP